MFEIVWKLISPIAVINSDFAYLFASFGRIYGIYSLKWYEMYFVIYFYVLLLSLLLLFVLIFVRVYGIFALSSNRCINIAKCGMLVPRQSHIYYQLSKLLYVQINNQKKKKKKDEKSIHWESKRCYGTSATPTFPLDFQELNFVCFFFENIGSSSSNLEQAFSSIRGFCVCLCVLHVKLLKWPIFSTLLITLTLFFCHSH